MTHKKKPRLEVLATLRLRKWEGPHGPITVLVTDDGCQWNPGTGDLNEPEDGELIIEAVRLLAASRGEDTREDQ